MRRYIPTWFAVMIALSVGIVLHGLWPSEAAPQPTTRPLKEWIWVDKIPQDPKESFKAYYFGPDGFAGMIDAPTCYKVALEFFEFREDGKTISYFFPHDDRKASSAYQIERLRPPTQDFDCKLTIARDPNNRNKKTVYFTGPNLRSQDTLPLFMRQALERERIRLAD